MVRLAPLLFAVWLAWAGCPDGLVGQEKAEHWVAEVDWAIEPFEKPRIEARVRFRRARLHLQDGNAEAALPSLYEALEIDPGRSVLRLFLGYAHLRLGELTKALVHLDHVRESAPYDPQSFWYAGRCHELAGRNETALDHYLEALARQPDSEFLWRDLERVVRRTGRTVSRARVEKRAFLRRGEDGRFSILLTRKVPDPVSLAWLSYAATRARWVRELHHRQFPLACSYRHTYREESEAWRALVRTWVEFRREDPDLRDADLDRVASLEARGLLEGFVLVEQYDRPFLLDLRAGASSEAVRYLRQIVVSAGSD